MSSQHVALNGLRVLDASESIAGQYCGRMLADYGAEVTLIEPPTGSALRRREPFDGNDDSLLFFNLNLGKHSVSLDPMVPSGRKILFDLVKAADVVLVGPGLDRGALQDANPKAVVALVSGFGETGPLAQWGANEMIYQALSGMMKHNGELDREPLYGCGDRASYSAGVATYVAVLAALFARRRVGKGQSISVDIAETASAMSYPLQLQYIYNGSLEARGDQKLPLGKVKCRDGWMTFWIFDDRWEAACRAFDVAHLIEDPRFAKPADRIRNWAALTAILQEKVAQRAAEDVVEEIQAAGVVAGKAYRPSDFKTGCAHLHERGYWQSVSTERGEQPMLGPQFRMSRTPRSVRSGPPRLGQDNERIYESMGLNRDEIGALRRAGVI